MTINSIYPYMEKIEDITTAKVILETLSDPYGYYYGIYSDIKESVENDAKEKRIRKIINRYYDETLIYHYEYVKATGVADENLFRKILGQESFSQSISKIKTKEELQRYLEILKDKIGEEKITYNTYVPKYKPKKQKQEN